MKRHDLTDAEWEQLPEHPRQGERWKDHRTMINGAFFRTRSGITWRDLCIAAGKTCREAIRCLKRYAARELYRIMTEPRQQQPPPRRWPLDIHRGIKRAYVYLGTVTVAALAIWLRT